MLLTLTGILCFLIELIQTVLRANDGSFTTDLTGSLLQLAEAAVSSQPELSAIIPPGPPPGLPFDLPAWPWPESAEVLTASAPGELDCSTPFSFDASNWTQGNSLDHTL